jgi:hypothetical protein
MPGLLTSFLTTVFTDSDFLGFAIHYNISKIYLRINHKTNAPMVQMHQLGTLGKYASIDSLIPAMMSLIVFMMCFLFKVNISVLPVP